MNDVVAVVIGRNEGSRLDRCFASLEGSVSTIVYVDSGSSDDSILIAEKYRALIVELDAAEKFSAGRARNAGFRKLVEFADNFEFVQFVDGDCKLDASWLTSALRAFQDHANVGIVCGRRREEFPSASVWNRLIDIEWNTPIGETNACGGDSLIRREAFEDVGGFLNTMIAGEEPEMCLRMRRRGWKVLRIDAEMTLHDAAIKSVAQWWRRCVRAGHAFAEGARLHGLSNDRFWLRETASATFWGFGIFFLVIVGITLFGLFSLWLLLLYPIQVFRNYLRSRDLGWSFFVCLGKIAEAQGVGLYLYRSLSGSNHRIVEYK